MVIFMGNEEFYKLYVIDLFVLLDSISKDIIY